MSMPRSWAPKSLPTTEALSIWRLRFPPTIRSSLPPYAHSCCAHLQVRFATKIYHPLVDKDDGKFCNEAIAENWKAVNNLSTVVTTVYEMLQVALETAVYRRTTPTATWRWIPTSATRCATTALPSRRLPRSGPRNTLAAVFVNKQEGKACYSSFFSPSICYLSSRGGTLTDTI